MKKNRTIVCTLIFCFTTAGLLPSLWGDNASNTGKAVNILLLMDDDVGVSYVVGVDKIKSIRDQLESFGWNLTLVGLKKEVRPCPWGVKNFKTRPLKANKLVSEISDLKNYHALIILPGRDYKGLLKSSETLKLIKRAVSMGMPVAAWCRGVRLLAAADVIKGKKVIGNYEHYAEYTAAGADAVNYSVEMVDGKRTFKNITPPIIDGNIITTVRSLYYRDRMCQLIKSAVDKYVGQD